MSGKKKLFERMNSIGEMPMNENINEQVPHSGQFYDDLKNVFEKYGYYLAGDDPYVGVSPVKIEGNEESYQESMEDLAEAINKIGLPW